MDRARLRLAQVDRARFVDELVADEMALSKQLALRRSQGRKHGLHRLRLSGSIRLRIGRLIALRTDAGRHRRLLYVGRTADRARDEAPRLLRLIIFGRPEPCFENMM